MDMEHDTLDDRFQRLSDRFVENLWEQEPEWATSVGYHKYDNLLPLPDSSRRARLLGFLQNWTDSLQAVEAGSLNSSNRISYNMLKNFLEMKKWELQYLKEYEWNPSIYNVAGTIAYMLSEDYAPLDERLNSCYERIVRIPAYYEAAKKQIRYNVDELRQLAIDQSLGGVSVFNKDFLDSVGKSGLNPEKRSQMVHAAQQAVAAINDYAQYLKQLKKPVKSFRLGKELYEQKFNFYIESAYTAGQMYDSALARKSYLHKEMARVSSDLWHKYFGKRQAPVDPLQLIALVIDTISTRHVKPSDFQSAIEKQLPDLVSFVNDKKLLYLDSSKPLVVRKEPAYMAGVAGASISAPGPYDKGGNTYYNVGSLEGWTAERAGSYLREYNHYILQILNIHEAIPGHYTQLVYANRNPSLVKTILANNATIEGWAVYTEQMMLENGYGNNEPEMWLMWYKWHLRTVCNTILDYNVHVHNMSRQDALDLLIKEAFQQKAEAEGKWKRVSVTSVQLTSYYSGYKAIYELREQMKSKEGPRFDLRVFHEKFLSYGNAPVKYISSAMLQGQ